MQNISGVPVARQSALDKAKAEAKAKKLRDEKEAASALEDFVKEFDADLSDEDNPPTTKEWRTGGTEGGMLHSSSQGSGARVSLPRGGARRHFTTAPHQEEDESFPKAGKKRNLDSFLEEIKRDQAVQDSRTKYGTFTSIESSSRERIDPETSAKTLHLACLPLSTRQSQLRELLAPYGEIVSVIIINETPSSKDFSRRSVSANIIFSKPYEAEKAQTSIDGRYLGEGWRVKASWGDFETQKSKDISSAPFGASVPTQTLTKAQLSRAPPPSVLVVPSQVPKWGQPQQLVVRVQRPMNSKTLRRIHSVIEGVAEYGAPFEALLMEREKYNEDYAFLFDSTLPDAQYYRWKTYSLQSGDTPYSWRTEPFQMFVDGEYWIPPEPVKPEDDEVLSNPDEEEDRIANRIKGFLGQSGQKKLLWLLRRIEARRGSVARVMAYAMERSDAAEEIVDIIIASLCSPETPLATKIARLYLISDILHNSSSGLSNVWKYRQLFEARLATVFEHLHEIYASFDGRIKADNFRRQVMAVTSVWETWMVFNNANVEVWIKTFLGCEETENQEQEEEVEEVVQQPVEQKGRWKSVAETSGKDATELGGFGTASPVEEEGEDGVIDGEPMEEENVDGEEMEDEDLNGEDVDGEPMDDEDVDGASMEENMEESVQAPPVRAQETASPAPEPQPDTQSQVEQPPPRKRQRMRAVDMFTDE